MNQWKSDRSDPTEPAGISGRPTWDLATSKSDPSGFSSGIKNLDMDSNRKNSDNFQNMQQASFQGTEPDWGSFTTQKERFSGASADYSMQNASALWWKQTASPAALLARIQADLDAGKSLILYQSETLPWSSDFLKAIQDHILAHDAYRRLEKISSRPDPFRLLKETYVPASLQLKYRPGMDPGSYLAQYGQDLHNRCIWVRHVKKEELPLWQQVISSYLQNTQNKDKAIFILETSCPAGKPVRLIEDYDLSKTSGWFDFHVFCTLLASSFSLEPLWKLYLAEVLSSTAMSDPELASLMPEQLEDCLKDPYSVLKKRIRNESHQNGLPFPDLPDQSTVDRDLWSAQLRVLFPLIEQFRKTIIENNARYLSRFVPLEAPCFVIEDVHDLEIGHLAHLLGNGQFRLWNDFYSVFPSFQRARNLLAHLNPVSWQDVQIILDWMSAHPECCSLLQHS